MSSPDVAPDEPLSTELIRATELIGVPVVSVESGNAVGDVKDVLYDPEQGRLLGFTLNKRGGLFAGPLKHPLGMDGIVAIGRDAVMSRTDEPWGGDHAATSDFAGRSRNVLGNEVLTDSGDRLGTVNDLVVEIGHIGDGAAGDVVGYQVVGDPDLQGRMPGAEGGALLVPLPDTLAVSGSRLIVPASVAPYVRGDLSGFGLAVNDFRSQLGRPLGPGDNE